MTSFFSNLFGAKSTAPSNEHLLKLRAFAGALTWEYSGLPESLSQRPDLVFLTNLLHGSTVNPDFIATDPYLWKSAIALLKEPAVSLLQLLKQPEEAVVRTREIFQALSELQGVEDPAYDTGLTELKAIFGGISGSVE